MKSDGSAFFSDGQRQRIAQVAGAAMELPSSERRAFVHHQCADDAAVLSEILSLLEVAERTGQTAFLILSAHARLV